MQDEVRVPVPGFPGYEASSLGHVISHKGRAPRVLRGGPHPDGYPMVQLHGPDGRRGFMVHAVIAAAFIGPRPPGMEVCHNDNDKLNNTPENLRYGTRTENEHDKRRHGTHHHTRKTHCPKGHPYDEANTYRAAGRRYCRACMAARER